MLSTLINKELKSIIQSPKFVGSFAVCSILILLSVYIGIMEYRAAVDQHQAAMQLVDEELLQGTSWAGLSTKAYREPDPMQIFVSGVQYDIGRWSSIGSSEGVKLRHSSYSDDPIFAVFRFVDFAFIVMFVLSLMAIQFTYDAVNGERESGTLKLVFSNAVPRARYLIAKCTGSWLGLALPLGIPILLSLLLVIAMRVPLNSTHWIKLGMLILLSLLLFTFFILLGVFVSTVTRRSSVSFLVALLIWVGFVMIIPRAGVMAAGGLVDIPRQADIEARKNAFGNEKWTQFITDMTSGKVPSCSKESQEFQDSATKAMEQEIEEYDTRLREDFRQRKIGQENLAWTLARLSPASAYQLAAMTLAATDTDAKARYEDAMSEYRNQFNQHAAAKQAETGEEPGIKIMMSMDADGGNPSLAVDASRSRSGLETSDMPRFSPPQISLSEAIGPAIPDFGVLCFDILLVFAAAFVSFLRYDLR
jgi:ABC-type transport system involved in multi-copper enzyme maturation permease subunit